MRRKWARWAALPLLALSASAAWSFCGFYVAKADTKLFNKASKVVMVRDADRTVLTMANDFKGDPKEFAVVVPVPTFLEREQINVAERALIDHLDAYSAPRLVEYFDEDPCDTRRYEKMARSAPSSAAPGVAAAERAKALGVTIEAQYTVGEYDILILSANESAGLETWLTENGYKIPKGAGGILQSYIKQKLRFFVAKVNLEKQSELGFTYLRPIQVAYESPKFMLPIRLGMVNADGPQELFVFALTRTGRVETTNYRTVRLPSEVEIPLFVKNEFADFYRAMFDHQVKKEDGRAVFLEYAWDMAWCDPCAADPLSNDELLDLGVFWLDEGSNAPQQSTTRVFPPRPIVPPRQPAQVFISRLHVRYDNDHFPEDLVFQETGDRSNFQGRYILRHPFEGRMDCPEGGAYREKLRERREKEAQTLAGLTGWEINDIRAKMKIDRDPMTPDGGDKWYKKLWKRKKKE